MNTPPDPPGSGPPGPPGPPATWPPPSPPPPPPSGSTGVVVALAFVGVLLFTVINVAAFITTLAVADAVGSGKLLIVGIAALLLAAVALGGGALLIILRRPWSKGLGLGLMIGWALATIVSAGFCTGVNPSIYTGGAL